MTSKKTKTGWKNFITLCASTDSNKMMDQLFDLFFTLDEKEQLNARCLIVKALIEGKLTQRQIADELGVSISQITRGSNELKTIEKGLTEYLKTQLDVKA